MLITILGRPIPAVRMTGRGKFINPAAVRYLAYKEQIGWMALTQTKRIIINPVIVDVKVFLHGVSTPMGLDGDVDNYLKSALDGCNKVVWIDDRQVQKATVEKISCQHDSGERMEIEVWEVAE